MNVKTAKTKAKKEPQSIDARVREYFEAERVLLDKAGLSKRLVVLFPRRPFGAPSWFGKILLRLLRSQGGILDIEFTIKK